MGEMPGSVQASWGRARGRRGHVLRTSRSLQEHKNHKEHKGKERKRVSSSALALDWLSSGANNATFVWAEARRLDEQAAPAGRYEANEHAYA